MTASFWILAADGGGGGGGGLERALPPPPPQDDSSAIPSSSMSPDTLDIAIPPPVGPRFLRISVGDWPTRGPHTYSGPAPHRRYHLGFASGYRVSAVQLAIGGFDQGVGIILGVLTEAAGSVKTMPCGLQAVSGPAYPVTSGAEIRAGLPGSDLPISVSYRPKNQSQKKIIFDIKSLMTLFGAGGGTRTLTVSPQTDFESVASTSSATPARNAKYA